MPNISKNNVMGVFLALTVVSSFGCGAQRVHHVRNELFASLPNQERDKVHETLADYESKLRVIRGRIAKARTDFPGIQKVTKQAEARVRQRKLELKQLKQQLKKMKQSKADQYEKDALKGEIELAKREIDVLKADKKYQRKLEDVAQEEIRFYQDREKFFMAQMENLKMRAVGEFAEAKNPRVGLQVAYYREQEAEFEVKQSKAKVRLAKVQRQAAEIKTERDFLRRKLPNPDAFEFETATASVNPLDR